MSSHHQFQSIDDDNSIFYQPTVPIDMAALCLIVGIEEDRCMGLNIHIEDWARLGFPVWCGLVPIHVVESIPMNTIEALRGSIG